MSRVANSFIASSPTLAPFFKQPTTGRVRREAAGRRQNRMPDPSRRRGGDLGAGRDTAVGYPRCKVRWGASSWINSVAGINLVTVQRYRRMRERGDDLRAGCRRAAAGIGPLRQIKRVDGDDNPDRHLRTRRHLLQPGPRPQDHFRAETEARPGRAPGVEVRQHRKRGSTAGGRDRVRLHGLELDRARKERRVAVRRSDRSCHGRADECRPAVLRRAGGIADPIVFRPAWTARRGRPAHERDGAARPRNFRRARHELFRAYAGLSRLCRRGRGLGRRRNRCPVAMSHPQPGHDRPRPADRGACPVLRNATSWKGSCRRCPFIVAP